MKQDYIIHPFASIYFIQYLDVQGAWLKNYHESFAGHEQLGDGSDLKKKMAKCLLTFKAHPTLASRLVEQIFVSRTSVNLYKWTKTDSPLY